MTATFERRPEISSSRLDAGERLAAGEGPGSRIPATLAAGAGMEKSQRVDEPGSPCGAVAAIDGGLKSLGLLLRFNGVAADEAQIAHRFGGQPIGVNEMLRCAKDFKLKARAV